MSDQIPDKDYVYSALLRYNYLPLAGKDVDEIPFEVFSTEALIPVIANELLQECQNTRRRKGGYDQIEYRVNRFNNVTRLMHIPHPLAYAHLCKCISENWDKLKHICENEKSRLKPRKYDNPRKIRGESQHLEQISMMSYERFSNTKYRVDVSMGKFYRVKADISLFYPSIYTHSIPWALVGHNEAKKNAQKGSRWYNKFDKAQRDLKRSETQGIPIGPGTSHLISEIILYKVDEALCDKYDFTRYIDDYECYCYTREEAEAFIHDLEQELRQYLLNLNVRKVLIEEMPVGYQTPWAISLRSRLSSKRKPAPRDIVDFLDSAVNLYKDYPEGNILKYTARVLANSKEFRRESAEVFLEYCVALAVHTSSVLPIVCQIARKHGIGSDVKIDPVLEQSIKHHRSDAMCWCLYYMGICDQELSEEFATAIVKTQDCMAMGMLIALNQHREKVVEFLNTEIDPNIKYDCDQYWLLIHELASDCPKFDDYREESGLDFLRSKNVSFIKPIDTASAEAGSLS